MSAQRLRDAAKTLRERAEAATPGPWRAMEHDNYPGDEGVALLGSAPTVTGSHMIGYFHVGEQAQMEADGALAATMHPGVALALAQVLESLAFDREVNDEIDGRTWSELLAVADLILGSQS